MKLRCVILLLLGGVFAARGASLLVSDPFTDGSRSNTNGGDAQGLVYYMGQTTSALIVTNDSGGIGSGNALLFTPAPASGFGKFLAYFGPVTLTNPGDSVTVTFNYRFGIAPTNINAGLRMGLYNTMGTRQTNDASDTTIPGPGDRSDDVGYGFQSNPGTNSSNGTSVYSEASGNDILGGASPSQTANVGTAGASVNSGTNTHFALFQISLQPNGNLALVAYLDNGLAANANIAAASVFTNAFDELGIEEGGTGFSVPLFIDNLNIVTTTNSDFDSLRTAWWQLQTGGTNYSLTDPLVKSRLSSITNTALSDQSSMDKTGTNTFLWSDLTSTTDSSQLSTAYARLQAMALAYATYGSALRSNATLATNIQIGLNWMYAHRYNESFASTSGEYDNWYDWEIGAPLEIIDIAVYMYDALGMSVLSNTLNAVDHFVPSPFSGTSGTSTGGNLTDKIRSVAVRGAVVKDASKLTLANNAFSSLYQYVTSGDGFYADGSYIQHVRHPYNGSYGLQTIQDVALVLPWLVGAPSQYTASSTQTNIIVPWRCTDPAFTNAAQWIYTNYQPFLYYGEMMDMTRGRAVSRYSNEAHVAGAGFMEWLLTLADSTFPSASDSNNIRGIVKYLAQVDTFRNFTNNTELQIISQAEQLMSDTSTPPRGELIGHYTFAGMDQAVHLRPGWGFAVSMSSSRVYNYESINSENLHGWFQGDGMTYFYTSNDLGQFSSNFWPTVDPYSLPGTTVDTTTLANAAGQSTVTTKSWTGGVTLGTNGSAGLDLAPVSDPLTGKKSWFMLDDEVVCLGAGITCTDTADVQTAAVTRKLAASNTNVFSFNGTNLATTLGLQTNLTNTSWCWLGGFGGCYFPGGATLKSLRSARSSTWSQINAGGTTGTVVNDYLSLWFDHGVKPTNATYAYVVLPNYTQTQASNYALSPEIAILENSTNAQAIKETTINVEAANFWQDAVKTVDLITVNRKAAVMTQQGNGTFSVAISDPTQTNTAGISVTLNTGAYSVQSADPAITVTQLQPTIQFTVNTSNAFGCSFAATFVTSNSPPVWSSIPATNINPGTLLTLNLSNYVTDPDLPYQTLTFALSGSSFASIDPNTGVFTWTPTVSQAGLNTNFVVRAIDHGGTNNLSANQFLSVGVYHMPALNPIGPTNGGFALGLTSDAGSGYFVQGSTDLVHWVTLYTNNPLVAATNWIDPASTNTTARFYRILLGQ